MRPTEAVRPTSVLLVENDSMDAQRLRQQLSVIPPDTSTGLIFTLECCDSLESGLARLALGGIDVVLLDLSLPDAVDLEALQKMRRGHEEIPVVVLSEDGYEGLGVQAIREGAQDYLTKTACTRDTVVRAVIHAIERQRLQLRVVRSRWAEQMARERCEQQAMTLVESNAELRLFTHIVSSSFRIPLEAITSYSRQLYGLLHGKGDGISDALTENLVQGVERMQKFVQGLADYLSIDGSDRPFTPCDSVQLFKRACDRLQPVIARTQASVHCEPLPFVEADAEQVVTLFWQLLDNALKFHQDGLAPRVQVYYETWGPEGAFAVRDEGVGIAESNLSSIFKLFQRGPIHHSTSGIGSGLAICRRIVERHGGRLWVESEPNQGTIFYFTLGS